ncbi:hypothetical protein VOLCADRAFT_96660 [Volvox carteri f. nagariensis]|uniref:Cation/H+ exchanger domain-containing protein n=1 Tax=Volvox carteri f. nagariensis TaxID=3068 RepID=D8UAQ2_VOLCA|nr:uncharacterized protein VOLCADRAFT_96660 [Volvox carteri f. nagariensis]EFJ43143.1 hypothetical protein VOLCADRAFT_96660 [Volvox carteri f. nagariensis]|eukprot:XP_002955718.1 hypothetical protein VOLCADRAFT_96660 [Volvox carteri f. nagariensis]
MFRRVGPAAVRLLLLPGLVEAFTTAGVAVGLMNMPVFWALTQGFILKAVGPAVVIQTMFDLQKRGLGVNKGIPAIVVGAASFDDMVAISGYSLFSSFAMSSLISASGGAGGGGGEGSGGGGGGGGGSHGGQKHGLVWTILHGPLDITLGALAGLMGAALCAATRLWDSSLKRTAVVFAVAMALLFALYRYDFRGGGALAALVLGLAVNVFWERGSLFFWGVGRRSGLTRGPQPRYVPSVGAYAAEVEARVGLFWRVVAQPMLFGIIGSLVNLRTVSGQIIPRSLALVAIVVFKIAVRMYVGMAVRIPTTYFAMTGAGLTVRERMFVAIAWTPKATVQAALGAQPLDMIRAVAGPQSPFIDVGHEILTTSVFAILICANVGVSLIHYLAPKWLHRTVPSAIVVAAAAAPPPPQTPPPGPYDTLEGCGAEAGEPSGPEAAAAERHDAAAAAAAGTYGSGCSEGDGGAVAAAGGHSVRPLRVGPVGYNWAEESFSPTPRSIRRSLHGGGLLAAALDVAAADGGSGGLWCRCGGAGRGGDGRWFHEEGYATDSAAAPLTARAELPRGGKPPLPPAAATPPPTCRTGNAAVAGVGSAEGSGGGSSSESDRGGGTGTFSMSATECTSPENDTAVRQMSYKAYYEGPQLKWPGGVAGWRRCRRCRGILPPTPSVPRGNIRMPSPRTEKRPQHRLQRRTSMRMRYGSADSTGGAVSGSDVEAGDAAAPPTAFRRHSAPLLTDVQVAAQLWKEAAAVAAALSPELPGGGAATAPPPAAASASLQRQLAVLERTAEAVAALAARLAAATSPSPDGDSVATAPSFATDARELADHASMLSRAAGAVRIHLSSILSAAAASHNARDEWQSGEEADDEGAIGRRVGGDGDGDGGGEMEEGLGDEPPPPETARDFFRRIESAAAATAAAVGMPDPTVNPASASTSASASAPPPPLPASSSVVIPVGAVIPLDSVAGGNLDGGSPVELPSVRSLRGGTT